MPLIEIEFIGDLPPAPGDLARQLADALGEVFQSGRGQTWVRLRSLPTDQYAENGEDHPLGAEAIFVSITNQNLPSATLHAHQANTIATVVATICQRSADRVHLIYEPPARGRVASVPSAGRHAARPRPIT
jgi:phenylpyruvate tautomerase PptA (4-oxalocrotonate tautomerase family)